MSKLRKPKIDAWEEKRQRIYAEPELIEALDQLAALNAEQDRKGSTRSKILVALAKDHLRKNSARLREAGYTVPDSVLKK